MANYQSVHTGKTIDDAVSRIVNTPGSGGVTYSDVGAAPDGYGLGGRAQVLENGTDLNDVVATGWYTTNSTGVMKSLINVPEVFMTGGGQPVFRVEICSTTWLIQTAYQIREASPYLTVVAERSCVGGVWQPWEYVNPPMAVGVEYRTTERWKGIPVYVKCVDCGALPNNTSKVVEYCDTTVYPFECYGRNTNSNQQLPSNRFGTDGRYCHVQAAANKIVVTTNFDASAQTGTSILVKYVKE